ncbi:MAG: hypothetical protein KIH10_15570, partial [Candidatus Freyarchaeota archaeon]|nr:hypothetical protein [Candidatus Jordarchaeia archaeon]
LNLNASIVNLDMDVHHYWDGFEHDFILFELSQQPTYLRRLLVQRRGEADFSVLEMCLLWLVSLFLLFLNWLNPVAPVSNRMFSLVFGEGFWSIVVANKTLLTNEDIKRQTSKNFYISLKLEVGSSYV